MRIRPFLLSSAAATAVLLGSSFAIPGALAQKGGILSPSSQWVVTKAGDQPDSAGTYCALAKRFQSGAVLTVARNQAGESSLAVNFHSRQFDVSRSIPVTLDPGVGQQRDYEIVPASDKALVVRMGVDSTFFDALEKTGYLRAEIEGRSYNFDLADIERGQGQLAACVANLVTPAAGEEVDGSGDAYRDEINALRQQVEALKRQNDDLRQAGQGDIASFSSDPEQERVLEGLKAENVRLREAVQDYNGEKAHGREQIASLEARIQALEAENKALSGNMEQSRSEAQAHFEAEIQRYQDENTDLKAELNKVKAQAQAAEFQLTAIQAEASRDTGAALKALQAEKEQLVVALAEANHALESAQADREQALEKAATAVDKTASLEESTAQIEAARLEAEQIRAERLKADEALQVASLRVTALEEDLGRMQQENKKLIAQIAALEADKAQASAGQAEEMAALRADNEHLQADMAEKLLAFEQERGEHKTVLTALRQDNETLQEDNKRLRTALAEQEIASQQALNRLETSAAEGAGEEAGLTHAEAEILREENTRLKADMEALEARLQSADLEKQKEMQDLARQYIRVKRLYEDSLARQAAPTVESMNNNEAQGSEIFKAQKVSAVVSTLSGEPVAVSLQPVPEESTVEIKVADSSDIALTEAQRFEEGMKAHRVEPAPLVPEEKKSDSGARTIAHEQNLDVKEGGDTVPSAYAILPEGLVPLEESENISAGVVEERSEHIPFDRHDSAAGYRPLSSSPAEGDLYRPSFALEELLDQAQLVRSAHLDVVQAASGPDMLAYQWKEDKVFASAEQKPLPDSAAFDHFVMDYLQRTQARCPSANFAILPDDTAQRGDIRIDSYEVACVGSGLSSSASLLFFSKGGTFTAMAHEAPTENMEEAMTLRDRVFKAITES